ncbi:MAG: hypothetical protein GY856_27295 [bacterium]|nr:hypothetical protein [bacterium]
MPPEQGLNLARLDRFRRLLDRDQRPAGGREIPARAGGDDPGFRDRGVPRLARSADPTASAA